MLFPRYLGASVVALGVDMGCFLRCCVWGGGGASALAYGWAWWRIGAVLAAVFVGIWRAGRDRLRQKALFAGTALLGLAVTTRWWGCWRRGAGCAPAKLVAIAASFAAT
jgi:hypothetical protein